MRTIQLADGTVIPDRLQEGMQVYHEWTGNKGVIIAFPICRHRIWGAYERVRVKWETGKTSTVDAQNIGVLAKAEVSERSE